MRYGLTLFAVLMSSSLFAGTTYGAGAGLHKRGEFGVSCRVLERGLRHCERHGAESCDRVEQAWRALCGPLEQIQASAAAEGVALDLLRQDYEIVPIDQAEASVFPAHVVIGPGDLDNPLIMLTVRTAFEVGKTVAIVRATQDELNRFQRIVTTHLRANCTPEGPPTAALYGLQKTTTRRPSQNASYCMVSTRDRDEAIDRRWLRERFAAAPPQAPAVAAVGEQGPTLDNLAANAYCGFTLPPSSLGTTGWDVYIYSMRGCPDQSCQNCSPAGDYYLVQINASYTPSRDGAGFRMSVRTPRKASSEDFLGESVRIQDTGPSTVTQYVSSYTNDKSTTVNGSVGWSQSDGFNVSAGGEITTSNSKTVTVPATKIAETVDQPAAAVTWKFTPQNSSSGLTFKATTTWVWFVPRDAYPDDGSFPPGGSPTPDRVLQRRQHRLFQRQHEQLPGLHRQLSVPAVVGARAGDHQAGPRGRRHERRRLHHLG